MAQLLPESAETTRALPGEAQWWPTDVLRARQWHWLQEILRVARDTSPFYRRRMAGICGLPVSPEQLRLVPPVRREDLAEHAREIAPARDRVRQGPEGRSVRVRVPLDRATYDWYVAGTRRGFQWWGVDPSDPVVSMLGRSWASRLSQGLVRSTGSQGNWRQFLVDHGFDDRIHHVLGEIVRFKPAVLYGYPSAVHRLVRGIREGAGPSRIPLKAVVLTGEPLYLFQRQAIADTLQCPVIEEYGSVELGSVAFECPNGTLHVAAETVFLETLPGDAGGERLLATHLRNRAFPLIRYEIGDIGVLDSEPCGCGRGLPTLRILGRASDGLAGARWQSPARPLVERCLGALPAGLQGRTRVLHPSTGLVVLEVERAPSGEIDRLDDLLAAARETFDPEWRIGVRQVERFVRLRSGKLPYFVRLDPTARRHHRLPETFRRTPQIHVAWPR
ncbi:MAG TPA: hypothetical protein VKZ50_13180 [bacterium]|nr:hypothetical protein [bacterium]